jgi:hypothetical protein
MESNYLSWSLILISLILSSVSLASSEWSVGAGGNQKIGLWRECLKSNGNYVCFNTRDATLPANISNPAAAALSDSARQKILFLRIGASVSVALLFLALFADVFMSQHEHMHMLCLVSLVLSIALSMVVLIVWATDKTLGKVRTASQVLSMGWYLQLASMVFAAIAFLLIWKHSYGFVF